MRFEFGQDDVYVDRQWMVMEPTTAHDILQWYTPNRLKYACELEMLETQLTLGREALDPELWVVMVSTVVMPKPTRAGAASMLIQKDTQDKMTIRRLGMYIWIR